MWVPHKMSNHVLHHEWKWWTAITTYLVTSLAPSGGCRKVYNNPPKILGKPLYKICVLGFCRISRTNREIQSWCWLQLKRNSRDRHLFGPVLSVYLEMKANYTNIWRKEKLNHKRQEKLEDRCPIHLFGNGSQLHKHVKEREKTTRNKKQEKQHVPSGGKRYSVCDNTFIFS